MSFSFSANQYEDAFRENRLLNWCVPRKYVERPCKHVGFSQFHANNFGHLLPEVPRSAESPWGTFKGTWDMPLKIPPPNPKYTARSKLQKKKLFEWKENSSLNNAANGFVKFPKKKIQLNKEYSDRPKAPSPPKSNDEENSTTPYVSGRPGYTPGPNVHRETSSHRSSAAMNNSANSRISSKASSRCSKKSFHSTGCKTAIDEMSIRSASSLSQRSSLKSSKISIRSLKDEVESVNELKQSQKTREVNFALPATPTTSPHANCLLE